MIYVNKHVLTDQEEELEGMAEQDQEGAHGVNMSDESSRFDCTTCFKKHVNMSDACGKACMIMHFIEVKA